MLLIEKMLMAGAVAAPPVADRFLFTWGNNDDFQTGQRTQTFSWTAVAAGIRHTAAIRSDFKLFTWGLNSSGQLGDGTLNPKSSPVQIGSSSWTAVAAGRYTTAAIRSDGALFTWGGDAYGVLGRGTVNTDASSPVQIGTSSWTAVCIGGHQFGGAHMLAIRQGGSLFAWGHNVYGQLGDGTTINRCSPVQIGTSSWTAISAGCCHSLAIRSGGSLFAWGYGRKGQTTVTNQIFSWVSVSSGAGHTMARRSDGSLWGWGLNSSGQLGDGTLNNRSSPVQIGTNTNWLNVTTGSFHTLALTNTGALFAWGAGACGRLGLGNTTTQSSPVQVGTSNWNSVSAGDAHSLGITTAGTLWAWGFGANGRLGDGTTTNKSAPVQIGTSIWTQVSAGTFHSLAIRSGGALFSWGFGAGGQLGNGTTARSSPVQVGTSNWNVASAGCVHSLGITTAGTLWAWGCGLAGRLGNGSTANQNAPVQIGTSLWTWVDAGSDFSLAVRSGGSLFSWGCNAFGQLGDSTGTTKSSPVQIGSSAWSATISAGTNIASALISGTAQDKIYVWGQAADGRMGDGGLCQIVCTFVNSPVLIGGNPRVITCSPVQIGASNWNAIAAGGNHSGAIRSDGALFTWGCNGFQYGRLGINSTTVDFCSSPVQVGTSSWVSISAGAYHTIIRNSLGTAWGFGQNAVFQLGIPNGASSNYPSPVLLFSGISCIASSSASRFTGIIGTNGLLSLAGFNQSGQLGNGTTIDCVGSLVGCNAVFCSTPTQLGTNCWIAVSAGGYHTLAIDKTNKLFAWGKNNFGQIGNNTSGGVICSPVQLSAFDDSSFTAVGAGLNHSAAISSKGFLYTWGDNSSGQLGLGFTSNVSTLIAVGSGACCWCAVSAGQCHTAAITTGRKLFTWGVGVCGRLGDGTTTNKSSPVQIGTSDWSIVSAGMQHTAAIRSDGALFTWGANSYGRLGDSTVTNRCSPVLIGTSSWIAVSAAGCNTLGITSTGALFSWGAGFCGRIGDGSISNRSFPVQLGTASWIAVAAGRAFSQAINSGGQLFAWGQNTYGQIGDGTTLSRCSPVLIGIGTSGWSAISTSSSGDTLAIRGFGAGLRQV